MRNGMRALSILQPWAWLIANGYKDVENRCWPTACRGPFLIPAGKRWGREQKEDLAFVRALFPHIPLPETFELGGIVGRATITGCTTDSESPWFFGPFGFEIAGAAPVPFKALRGQLGWFNVPADVLGAEVSHG